jgi:hypothetical protein
VHDCHQVRRSAPNIFKHVTHLQQIVGHCGLSDVSLLPDIPDGHHTLQMSGDYLILCCGLRVLKSYYYRSHGFGACCASCTHAQLFKDGVRLTDTVHTITVCTMIWQYAVRNFTNPSSSRACFQILNDSDNESIPRADIPSSNEVPLIEHTFRSTLC